MELGSREAESLLAARHGIAGDRMIAFRGRLEHLRRLGCPVGLQTGRGKRAVFGWDHLIQAAAALDLIELGITPESAAKAVIEHRHTLSALVAGLSATSGLSLASVFCEGQWPVSQTVFLNIGVNALSALRGDAAAGLPSLGVIEGANLTRWFGERMPTERAIMLLDLGTLVANLANFSVAWTSASYDETADDLIAWADKHGICS